MFPEPGRRRVTLKRRPNDFASAGPVFFQIGTTTCCCCLHWAGAAIGGVSGLVAGHRESNIDDPSTVTHPELRRFVVGGYCLGMVNTALLIAVLAYLTSAGGRGPLAAIAEFVIGTLVFVPALLAILIGVGACFGALAGQLIVARRDPSFARYGSGFILARRITWQLLLWMSYLSCAGYVSMQAIAILVD